MAVIESLMKTELITAAANESVADAAGSMVRNGVGAVLVLDGDRLAGILTERDVLERVVAAGRNVAATRVCDVATSEVVSVEVGTHVRACAELLREKGIRHLPVLRDGRPAGILSSRDLLAFVAEGLEQLVDRTRYETVLSEGDDPYDHLGGGYGR